MEYNLRSRKYKNKLFKGLVILMSCLLALPLLLILYYIFKQGITSIDWSFLVNSPKPVGEKGGGIANAIIGSLLLILTASIIAIPFGVMVGIYLSEYRKKRLASWTRLGVDVLQGIPSIAIGIIVYLWLVKPMKSFSGLSGSIALAIMMLPSIVRATEETLKLIPWTLKEGSLALGVPYYRTILRIIVPSGLSGILSGIILSIARIAGETAPLLFTAFGNPHVNADMTKPVSSLPLVIFNYATSPYEEWHQLAWGASFILIIMILMLNISTKIAQRKWTIQF